MSQFNAPVRRSGGDLNVYTGLLCAVLVILLFGVGSLVLSNMRHSDDGSGGGAFKFVDAR